jgi:hypothetical protein
MSEFGHLIFPAFLVKFNNQGLFLIKSIEFNLVLQPKLIGNCKHFGVFAFRIEPETNKNKAIVSNCWSFQKKVKNINSD